MVLSSPTRGYLNSKEAERGIGPPRIVALAGPVCAGKTTLANTLAKRFDAQVLAAREVIMKASSGGGDRRALQRAGRALEQRTQGRWLAEAAADLGAENLVVDAARTPDQARALLETARKAVLVYLAASEETCRRRYAERVDPADLGVDFDRMVAGELPLQPELRALADLVIDTDRVSVEEVADSAAHFLATDFGRGSRTR